MSVDDRIANATARILRNLTDSPYPFTRQLSTLYGCPADVALAALTELLASGAVEVKLDQGAHVYRLTAAPTTR